MVYNVVFIDGPFWQTDEKTGRELKRWTSWGWRRPLAYVFMDWRHIPELWAALETAKYRMINLCVWVKPNGGMGSLYRSRHELALVFGNGKHINNA